MDSVVAHILLPEKIVIASVPPVPSVGAVDPLPTLPPVGAMDLVRQRPCPHRTTRRIPTPSPVVPATQIAAREKKCETGIIWGTSFRLSSPILRNKSSPRYQASTTPRVRSSLPSAALLTPQLAAHAALHAALHANSSSEKNIAVGTLPPPVSDSRRPADVEPH